jgi:hypothetical protein
MKRMFIAAALILSMSSLGLAAQADKSTRSKAKANATAAATAKAGDNTQPPEATLDAGSQISADMKSSLDLKKAKPGDSFKMKTTKPVKRQGKELISRGSTITGHVQQVTTADNRTQATLVFDQLVDKKTRATSTLSAVVTAIAKPQSDALAAMAQEDAMASTQMQTRAQPRSSQHGSQQGGGLLGSVTQAVGGVTQGVTQAVGGVTQGATQTVGGATGQLGSTVNSTTTATLGATGAVGGLIQITNDTTAGAASGSTLTRANKNARLESGTQFLLQTTSALTLTKPTKQE